MVGFSPLARLGWRFLFAVDSPRWGTRARNRSRHDAEVRVELRNMKRTTVTIYQLRAISNFACIYHNAHWRGGWQPKAVAFLFRVVYRRDGAKFFDRLVTYAENRLDYCLRKGITRISVPSFVAALLEFGAQVDRDLQDGTLQIDYRTLGSSHEA